MRDSALDISANATLARCVMASAVRSPESISQRKGMVMNRRLVRIAVSSISAAVLLGLVGTGAAQASVPAATPSLVASVSPQTDPPGYCTADEIGQVKPGPDGALYECTDSPGLLDVQLPDVTLGN